MGPTAVVTMHEAKTNLFRLLNEVQNGKSLLRIAHGTKKIARLTWLDERKPVRTPGLLNNTFSGIYVCSKDNKLPTRAIIQIYWC